MKSLNVIIISSVLLLFSCNNFFDVSEYGYGDYRKFDNTPIAKLAHSVESGDTNKIVEFLKGHPLLIDYQEPYDSLSLLMMTIVNQRKATFPYSMICDNEYCGLSLNKSQTKSFQCLLNNGASVNVTNSTGETPLLLACGCDYYDISFIKELIEHGADVNYQLPEKYSDRLGNSTALQNAIRCKRYDIVKLLVEKGADVNYQDKYKNTTLGMSLYGNCYNYNTTLYLLEKGADFRTPIVQLSIHSIRTSNIEDTCRLTLVEELRYRVHPLGSDEYKQKMKIVEFLRRKGIDYNKTKIPTTVLTQIKKEYPDSWEDYIQKY